MTRNALKILVAAIAACLVSGTVGSMTSHAAPLISVADMQASTRSTADSSEFTSSLILVRDRRPWRPHGNGHGPAHWQDKLGQQIKRGIRRERRRQRRREIIGGIIGGAIILDGIHRGNQQRQQCNDMRYSCDRGNRYACDDFYRYCR